MKRMNVNSNLKNTLNENCEHDEESSESILYLMNSKWHLIQQQNTWFLGRLKAKVKKI
jgi:hypothetical protein